MANKHARAQHVAVPLMASLILLALSGCAAEGVDGGGADAGLSGVDEKECGDPKTVDKFSSEEALSTLRGCAVHRGKALLIEYAEGLENVGPLNNLREVSGNLVIDYCFDLVNLHGLERLEKVQQLGIDSSPSLQDVRALSSLRVVQDYLGLIRLEGLQSLTGLESLASVGGELLLADLPKVESLSGLEGVQTVGSLVIQRNDSLRSLRGLSQLERISGGLTIMDNPNLPQAEIDVFLSRVAVGGLVRVENNGP